MNLIQCFYENSLSKHNNHATDPFNAAIERRLIFQGIPIESIKPVITIFPDEENDLKKGEGEAVAESNELNLDQKLDVIIGTTKERSKGVKSSKRSKRNRKTKGQIEVLKKEMLTGAIITKELINELALKTGLTAMQVYKWYWDYKNSLPL